MSNLTYMPGLVLVLFGAISYFSIPCCCQCPAADNERYSYRGSRNGPSQWARLFPSDCNGRNQSPINIVTNSAVKDEVLPPLLFINYTVPIPRASMMNDGHSVQTMPGDNVRRMIYVDKVAYILQQLHFHWGRTANEGSEHTIDNKNYTMELHLVHVSDAGRTAVVGVFFEENEENKGLNPIVNSLPDVLYKDNRTSLKSPLVLKNLLPKNPESFYRYNGSLTTPDCNEGVIWSVLPKPVPVSQYQMKKFRSLFSVTKEDASGAGNQNCLIAPNNRPIQLLNGRRVVFSSK